MQASFLEIYQENIFDLLGKDAGKTKLALKEDTDSGVYVKGLSAYTVQNASELQGLLAVRTVRCSSTCVVARH